MVSLSILSFIGGKAQFSRWWQKPVPGWTLNILYHLFFIKIDILIGYSQFLMVVTSRWRPKNPLTKTQLAFIFCVFNLFKKVLLFPRGAAGSISICEQQPLGSIQRLLFKSIRLVTVPGGVEPPHMWIMELRWVCEGRGKQGKWRRVLMSFHQRNNACIVAFHSLCHWNSVKHPWHWRLPQGPATTAVSVPRSRL